MNFYVIFLIPLIPLAEPRLRALHPAPTRALTPSPSPIPMGEGSVV
jgi:hypothetical protein